MRGFLTDAAGTEYDHKIKESGAFTTYQSLKDWLIAHYSTSDPINTYRDRFFNCFQKENESFDDYFQRFRDARSNLDSPLSETYVVYHFVRQLLPPYFQQIRGDKEFSEYKNITLDDVLAKLKRTNARAVVGNTRGNTSAQSGHDNRGNSSNKRRRTDYQQSNTPRTQQSSSAELTDGQKRFVDAQIKRGGGNQFFESVQNNTGWQTQAKQANLCFKCASPRHYAQSCNAPLPRRQNTGTSVGGLNSIGDLNSLIPDEEIDYLNDQQQP
jgi:hypothetical protein